MLDLTPADSPRTMSHMLNGDEIYELLDLGSDLNPSCQASFAKQVHGSACRH